MCAELDSPMFSPQVDLHVAPTAAGETRNTTTHYSTKRLTLGQISCFDRSDLSWVKSLWQLEDLHENKTLWLRTASFMFGPELDDISFFFPLVCQSVLLNCWSLFHQPDLAGTGDLFLAVRLERRAAFIRRVKRRGIVGMFTALFGIMCLIFCPQNASCRYCI